MKLDVKKLCFLTFLFVALPFVLVTAQEVSENKEEKKVVVITKTIDENGNVTVEKIIKEGADISDEEIEKMMEEAGEKEVKVTVRTDKKEKDSKVVKEKGKSKTKSYTIQIDDEDVKINQEGNNVFIFKNDSTDQDVKVYKMKGEDGEDIEIKIEEIIEKKEEDGSQEEKDSDVLKWIQKDGEKINLEDGKVIIIEEEIEETGEGGKKVIKKKKIVKKKIE